MKRIASSKIPEWREALAERQDGICPLCERQINKPALDHCHKDGFLRATCCINCNALEGRILHYAGRSGIDPETFVHNVVKHWNTDFSHHPFHPQHVLEEEKERLQLKRKLKNLKANHAIERTRTRIKELNDIIKAKLEAVCSPSDWFK